MTPLASLIADIIGKTGPIPLSDYMALALGHPEYGYYRKSDPLGARGDFITAPEISQVFGELIGLWCAVTWRQAGAPDAVRLVELGPGRGTLMADALRALKTAPDFTAAIDLHLVETSPVLRSRQQEALRGHAAAWHDALHEVPDGPVLVVANEFFDALPVDQYVRTADGWRERRVDFDPQSGRFGFTTGATPPPETIPSALATAPDGSLFEHSTAREALAANLALRVASHGITALIVDYGHAQSGVGDTLQAVRGHAWHDVLAEPGEADLTSHVDFASLARAAESAGAKVHGPVDQGDFLTSLGAAARTEALAGGATAEQAQALRDGLERLIADDGMGTLFKVMALTNASSPPAGFEGRITGARG